MRPLHNFIWLQNRAFAQGSILAQIAYFQRTKSSILVSRASYAEVSKRKGASVSPPLRVIYP